MIGNYNVGGFGADRGWTHATSVGWEPPTWEPPP